MQGKHITENGSCKLCFFFFLFAGPEPTLFGKPKFCCMRLHYRNEETSGYFHTLRAATRNPEDDGKGRMCFFNQPETETF